MGRERDEGEVRVFTRASVREVDRLAGAEFGIPSIVLMENAALHLADVVLDVADETGVLIVCGPGNNGGDGLAAARHLANAGVEVRIVLSGPAERYKGDAAINLAIAQKMRLPIEVADAKDPAATLRGAARPGVVIDALLGTGAEKPVEQPMAMVIRAVNDLARGGVPIVAADLPSGMDCDTGEPLGIAVRATTTVSFVGLKEGFLRLAAQAYLGDVVVADIGAPAELVRRLGRPLADHELHDGPVPRPGHAPGGPETPRRKERG
jgi:NAD(P)H-hydrate epimerase